MRKRISAAAARRVRIAAYQEVALDDKDVAAAKATLTAGGWDSTFSPCCPESAKPTAGLATAVRHPRCVPVHAHQADANAVAIWGRRCGWVLLLLLLGAVVAVDIDPNF